VLASTATAANTAATAAMLLDSAAVAWLEAHRLDGVLTRWDGAVPVAQVQRVGRWPAGRDAA
jgi:thiamine biosynthesis lipoprotein ApbE